MVLKTMGPFAPPSVLPDISPSGGEISGGTARRYFGIAAELEPARAAGVISPLEGEMSGRTEGGRVEHLRGRFAIIAPTAA
jgi:hypothetical protein